MRRSCPEAWCRNGFSEQGWLLCQAAIVGRLTVGVSPKGAMVSSVMKALERENRELRQANEILRKASAYFAQAELDRRFKP